MSLLLIGELTRASHATRSLMPVKLVLAHARRQVLNMNAEADIFIHSSIPNYTCQPSKQLSFSPTSSFQTTFILSLGLYPHPRFHESVLPSCFVQVKHGWPHLSYMPKTPLPAYRANYPHHASDGVPHVGCPLGDTQFGQALVLPVSPWQHIPNYLCCFTDCDHIVPCRPRLFRSSAGFKQHSPTP